MFQLRPHTPTAPNKIAIVVDHPSQEDINNHRLFSDGAGRELSRMLSEIGILLDDCYQTAVFLHRPRGYDLREWLMPKKQADETYVRMGGIGKYPYKPAISGKYIDPTVAIPARQRLYSELKLQNINVILSLGQLSSWALLDSAKLSEFRGTICESPHVETKILPTYSPDTILAQWNLRVISLMDMFKAKRESEFPEIKSPRIEIWIEPTLPDIIEFMSKYLDNASDVSFDIETAHGQITCIGFAVEGSADITKRAIVIPFVDRRRDDYCYWSEAEEILVWQLVKKICENPNTRKVAQNGMYDIQWLWKICGITPRNFRCDTMILHHSLYPELPKSLGFLGSIYTDFPTWKHMRTRHSSSNKQED